MSFAVLCLGIVITSIKAAAQRPLYHCPHMFLRRVGTHIRNAAHIAVSGSGSGFPHWVTQRASVSAAASDGPSMGKGNFFAFFGFAKQPELDTAELQKRYHALQKRVHPDQENIQAMERSRRLQAGADSEDADHSPLPAGVSMYANRAYETLRNPYARCRYLARLDRYQNEKGSPLTAGEEEELLVEDDARAIRQQATTTPTAPPSESFLLEMLAMNELIFTGDPEDPMVQKQWKVLLADLDDRSEGCRVATREAWATGNMSAFHASMQEWTYVENIRNHLRDRM